ncbi:MAG: hypothetical protein J6Y56_03870 [Fibrobacterales bacterium]|nr:hypothetical protein [Fibrobacterales bacterium]
MTIKAGALCLCLVLCACSADVQSNAKEGAVPLNCLLTYPRLQRITPPVAGFRNLFPASMPMKVYDECLADTTLCNTIKIDEGICAYYMQNPYDEFIWLLDPYIQELEKIRRTPWPWTDENQEKPWIVAYIHYGQIAVSLTMRMNAVDVMRQKFIKAHPPEMSCRIYNIFNPQGVRDSWHLPDDRFYKDCYSPQW